MRRMLRNNCAGENASDTTESLLVLGTKHQTNNIYYEHKTNSKNRLINTFCLITTTETIS